MKSSTPATRSSRSYRGTNKATGAPLDAQFAHIWRVSGGQATAFQQYTDTLKAARAAGHA